MLTTFPEVFDAVEFSGMYSALTKHFNRRATAFAKSAQLPVVGNSDTHFLWQLGHTFSLIDAPADPVAVVEAIRSGRVQLRTEPLRWRDVIRFIGESGASRAMLRDGFRYLHRIVQRNGRQGASTLSHPAEV
ncbi:MAG: hypothetical protein HY270_18635 [Deltaproteobacteria bacterium]|nr:hypothetical protein [Deltaproteobacteria bacterium]